MKTKIQIQIQSLISGLNATDTATVIFVASEAFRQCCGFARAYADLCVYISAFDNGEDDWIREDILDIKDERELVKLITQATFRLEELTK